MKIFLNVLMLIWFIGYASLMLLPFNLNFNEWLSASCILGGLITKLQIDRTELENKIFELKELLKDKNFKQ